MDTSKLRKFPSQREIKEGAMRIATVEKWNEHAISARLKRDWGLKDKQVKAVMSWLTMKIIPMDKEIPLGDEVRSRRESLGATVTELSKISGVRNATIASYEQGRRVPHERTVVKILDGLDKLTKRRYNERAYKRSSRLRRQDNSGKPNADAEAEEERGKLYWDGS